MAVAEGSEIPQQLDELTSDFLTSALRRCGKLGEAHVSQVKTEPIGEGEGFMGVLARLSLDYEGEPGDAPTSMIVKLPTPTHENRIMGELMGVYWREIHFYAELSHRMPLRTPGHHFSVLTDDPMRTKQYKIVAVLDRMPGWVVDPMMKVAKKQMKESGQRYLLMLEDLGHLRVGDQINGGTLEACTQVLAAVARMHAGFWGSPELKSRGWLANPDVNPRIRHRMYLDSRASFLERNAQRLGDVGLEALAWLDQHGAVLGRRMHRETPHTLIHCDLRLDNIFFDDESADDPIVLGDWQMVGHGSAAYDVAYLLSGALDPSISADEEMALLHTYHEALCAAGVGGYPFDRFVRDYQRGLLAVYQVLGTTDQMELGEDRGSDLMDMWIDRTLARLQNVDLERLL
jgi:hypothetical protein